MTYLLNLLLLHPYIYLQYIGWSLLPHSIKCMFYNNKTQSTAHVDVLLAGEPDAGVELPEDVLVLPCLPDVLDQSAVVQVGAVEADAELLFPGRRWTAAQRFHHLTGPLAPVTGAERAHGQEQGQEVQGESQRSSAPPVQDPHLHTTGENKAGPQRTSPNPAARLQCRHRNSAPAPILIIPGLLWTRPRVISATPRASADPKQTETHSSPRLRSSPVLLRVCSHANCRC